MKIYIGLILAFCLLNVNRGLAQDSLSIKTKNGKEVSVKQPENEYNPLAPSKAAFYSAVLPGLGQAYNHSYWKIPIIYAGLGISIYAYIENNERYHSYRNAYKRRLAGYHDDEYQGRISTEGLIEAQKQFRRYKEMSILAAVLIYALNIVDANVEAHLQQFNINENLSFKPNYRLNQFTGDSNYGLTLNFKF